MAASGTQSLTNEEAARIAQARSTICAMMNVHFLKLPNQKFTEAIRNDDYLSILAEIANDGNLAPEMVNGAALMLEYIHSTISTDAPTLQELLGIDRTRLYRGVAPNYGPPPPCEAVWTSGKDVTEVLVELSEIYFRAGMCLSDDARERADYIGVELEYQRLLAIQEAEAWRANERKNALRLLKEQYTFLTEHLQSWFPSYVEKALPIAETNFYRGHLLMLRGFLAAEGELSQELLERIRSLGDGNAALS